MTLLVNVQYKYIKIGKQFIYFFKFIHFTSFKKLLHWCKISGLLSFCFLLYCSNRVVFFSPTDREASDSAKHNKAMLNLLLNC